MAELLYSYAPALNQLDSGHWVFGNYTHACVFLVSGSSFSISRVDLALLKWVEANDVGEFTVEIREVNQVTLNPTGVILTSVSQNLNTVTPNFPPEWVTFTFGTQVALASGQYYAIVYHDTGYNNTTNEYSVLWHFRNGNPGIGILRYSDSSGVTWTNGSEYGWDDDDFGFRVYGDPVALNLVSPVDDATEVHSKDILTAEVVYLGASVVSSVQLYLNTVKVYDGGPQGAKPYLQWYVGAYCQPNTAYDWYVTATIDNVLCTSGTWTFTTAGKQDLHPSFSWWGDTPVWGENPPAYDIYFGTDPTGVDLDLIVDNWVEPEWVWGEGEWTGGAGGHWTAVGSGDGTFAEPDWSWYPPEYDTAYYWKINTGPVYTFTTMAFATPQWETKYLRLVAAANGKIWYEDI